MAEEQRSVATGLALGEIGLRPLAATVPQDWPALARHLAAQGMRLGTTPRQFAGGFGNLNYLIEIDGAPAVLRRPPAGKLPPGANDMAREHRILSALPKAYPLAPHALYFCADPTALGAPFQIIEYRQGIVIRDLMPPNAAGHPEIGSRLSRHLVASLAALHRVDPAVIGLDTLGRPQGFLARTLDGWTHRAAAVADFVQPAALDATIAWLRRQVPADAPPALLHSDFKLDNVILDPTSFAPVAVIDWDMGTRGDPLWDLAVMLSYWAEPGDPACMHRMRQMPTTEPGFWTRAEAFSVYCRLSGRPVADFAFYRVLSLFRSAIVFLQLFERWRRDPKANAGCAEFDALGRGLLEFAHDTAYGATLL
jgi:aminoglycoside phosphotransferase (APT) family kinase protein